MIYRFKQILQNDRLAFFQMRDGEVAKLNSGELETLEVRVTQESHRKVKVCPRLVTIDPKTDKIADMRKIIFDLNEKYFESEEQISFQDIENERERSLSHLDLSERADSELARDKDKLTPQRTPVQSMRIEKHVNFNVGSDISREESTSYQY